MKTFRCSALNRVATLDLSTALSDSFCSQIELFRSDTAAFREDRACGKINIGRLFDHTMVAQYNEPKHVQ